jgi:hypothetical protein
LGAVLYRFSDPPGSSRENRTPGGH